VLYIVWDDAGIATWNAFGGLIETPNLRWLAARGLRYSQWHTPALSSPTRSCLLTGREYPAGRLAQAVRSARGWREQSVLIPPDSGTLAEILHDRGYRTYCAGKWHLSPSQAGTITNSRRTWPLGRGFDRYYGFLGGQTSPWYPDLVYDNQHVDPRVVRGPVLLHRLPGRAARRLPGGIPAARRHDRGGLLRQRNELDRRP